MSPARRRALRTFAVAALAVIVLAVAMSACPLCKEDVADSGPSMWRGMYWSILLMLTMPFAAAGTVVLMILRGRRRQQAAGPAAKAPLPFPESGGARS